YRRASLPVERSLSERQSEHEAILEACMDRDPERAARAMHDHLAITANLLAHAMGVDDLFPRAGSEAS
ncbi:MAG TPA: FCD domain-containing protein, partial [Planctomycetota bacterium]|nr:FCD domain-containing protein [Planctomycetota bacterium]